MISKDDLVQQLLELDAEIAAAMQRKKSNEQEANRWSSGRWDREASALFGEAMEETAGSIQRLSEKRETLAQQIASMPDFE